MCRRRERELRASLHVRGTTQAAFSLLRPQCILFPSAWGAAARVRHTEASSGLIVVERAQAATVRAGVQGQGLEQEGPLSPFPSGAPPSPRSPTITSLLRCANVRSHPRSRTTNQSCSIRAPGLPRLFSTTVLFLLLSPAVGQCTVTIRVGAGPSRLRPCHVLLQSGPALPFQPFALRRCKAGTNLSCLLLVLRPYRPPIRSTYTVVGTGRSSPRGMLLHPGTVLLALWECLPVVFTHLLLLLRPLPLAVD